jgi:2-iminobutanoate/2-iminopropanoate deaminase
MQIYQPACMPQSDAPFSQVVIDDHYVHLSGIVAADFPAGLAALGDAGEETRSVMQMIGEILAELSLDFGHIVRSEVHLADLDDFDAMDDAYRDFFPRGRYPARTTTESRRLFGNSRVEITCMVERRQSGNGE